jgi:hypothetical protein
MRTPLLLFFLLFFDKHLFSQTILIPEKPSSENTNETSSGWRQVESTEDKKSVPCWESTETKATNPSDCLYSLRAEIARTKDKNEKKALKVFEEKLKKMQESVKKSFEEQIKNEKRIRDGNREIRTAYARANIDGCPGVEINPFAERFSYHHQVAEINIINNTKYNISIIASRLQRPAVENMVRGCNLTLHMSQDWLDSYFTNYSMLVKFFDGNGYVDSRYYNVSLTSYYSYYGQRIAVYQFDIR